MSNVNGQAVAQAKLEALIAVTQRWIAYMEVPQRREAWGPLVDDAKAAIAEARK